MVNRVLDLKNWSEEDYGFFVYDDCPAINLELLFTSYHEDDASTPKANLYVAGWFCNEKGLRGFERRLVADNRHVLECLAKAREIIKSITIDGVPVELLRNAEKDDE